MTHLGDCVWSGHDWWCVVTPWRLAHSFFQSNPDIQATICFDLWVMCLFPHRVALHECFVRATMSFRPLMPPGASGRACTHALHVHIIVYTFYPRAWSLGAAGLALGKHFWLDVWLFSLSACFGSGVVTRWRLAG